MLKTKNTNFQDAKAIKLFHRWRNLAGGSISYEELKTRFRNYFNHWFEDPTGFIRDAQGNITDLEYWT